MKCLIFSLSFQEMGIWNRFFKLAAALAFFALTTPAQDIVGSDTQAGNVALESVRLFSGGPKISEIKQRRYSDVFSRQSLTYLYFEAKIDNLLYQSESHTLLVTAVLKRPDRSQKEYRWRNVINQNSAKATLTGGMGFSTPGQWKSGQYTIQLFFGSKEMKTIEFWVVEGRSTTGLTFQYISVEKGNPNSRPLGYRQYAVSRFRKKDVARVNLVVSLRNDFRGIRANTVSVRWRVRHRGKVIINSTGRNEIQINWPTALLWQPITKRQGSWESGVYDVEFYLNGQYLAKSRFIIDK